MAKERKLSEAEITRTENLEMQAARLESEGYTARKRVIPLTKANVYAFLLYIPFGIVFTLIYHFVGGSFLLTFTHPVGLLVFVVAFIVLIVIHEGLHGFTWGLFCKNKFKSIQFGFIWKYLTPYCSCLEPLRFSAYILGCLMPLMVLGVGFFVVAAITKNHYLFYYANANVIGAGGDISIALMLLRNRKALIIDHPTECGFYAFEKQA
ncbi:MAG: DUF3267 domain-containing protein [Oscillospiraceae bacterium]|jgi:hypothetical protein|nr:DUF3267 domain-containing protein [Oscillospiraceae bacterium]